MGERFDGGEADRPWRRKRKRRQAGKKGKVGKTLVGGSNEEDLLR